ncbi:MAG: type II secretion system protein [Verrucomicrobia bacterium]|nr:type II secretion system protein [Verrucomicrobiota bacterium]
MKTNLQLKSRTRAFTRVEALACLGAVTILAAVAWPTVAGTRGRSDRVACVNNLRLIGRAIQTYSGDHGGMNHWGVNAPQGTRYSPYAGNVSFQFGFLSNELATPNILACPSDTQRRAAHTWGTGPRGFLNPAYRYNAVSYFLGLDVTQNAPNSVLAGDRDIPLAGYGSCSLPLANIGYVKPGQSNLAWTNGVHVFAGNLLLSDGRVRQTSSEGLRQSFSSPLYSDNGLLHLLGW